MRVTAVARRSGDWWAIEVPEVPGVFTQARRLDQVAAMVADAVSLMKEAPAESVEVVVRPELAARLQEQVTRAQVLAEAAAELHRTANAARQRLVTELRDNQGLTVRDVGAVLDLSPQRISQLEAAGAAAQQEEFPWTSLEWLARALPVEADESPWMVRSRLHTAFAELTKQRARTGTDPDDQRSSQPST